MKKQIVSLPVMMLLGFVLIFSTQLQGVELGAIIGTETNPSHLTYGLSCSMGFLIPLLKGEVELTRIDSGEESTNNALSEAFDRSTGLSLGIKFCPQLGKFSPYAVVGIGAEFDTFTLDFGDMEKYTFVGGGLYFHAAPMISLRGDLRFLNFSDVNRTRITVGVFVQF